MNLLNANLTINFTTPTSEPDEWDIDAAFLDYSPSSFFATDVLVGDRVFNDGTPLGQGVQVYKVVNIDPSTTFSTLVATIRWDRPRDIDTPLEPNAGFEGAIGRVVGDQSAVINPSTQLLTEAFGSECRNEENLRIFYNITNNIQQSKESVKENNDTAAIIKCMPVSDIGVVGVVRAQNTTLDGSTVIGFSDTASAAPSTNLIVQLSGLVDATTAQWDAVTGDTGGLVEGEVYYLGTTAGSITSTPPTTGFVVKVGNAVSPTTLNINIEAPIQL